MTRTNAIQSRRVVVGVDSSASARHAACWAADLAADWGASLRLVTVVSRADDTTSKTAPPWLRELAAATERAGAPTTTEVLFGSVPEQLIAQARTAHLIVLGSHDQEGWSGMLAGSTALPVIAASGVALVVVRGHHAGLAPPRGGPVVVGVDDTDAAAGALRFAVDVVTRGEHRTLVAVHAWSDLVRDLEGHARPRSAEPGELERRAKETLDRQLAPITEAHPELTIERYLDPDTPLRALLNRADNAWLIVVGQRAAPASPQPMFGSTSRGLVEFAACPVAVVPVARP